MVNKLVCVQALFIFILFTNTTFAIPGGKPAPKKPNDTKRFSELPLAQKRSYPLYLVIEQLFNRGLLSSKSNSNETELGPEEISALKEKARNKTQELTDAEANLLMNLETERVRRKTSEVDLIFTTVRSFNPKDQQKLLEILVEINEKTRVPRATHEMDLQLTRQKLKLIRHLKNKEVAKLFLAVLVGIEKLPRIEQLEIITKILCGVEEEGYLNQQITHRPYALFLEIAALKKGSFMWPFSGVDINKIESALGTTSLRDLIEDKRVEIKNKYTTRPEALVEKLDQLLKTINDFKSPDGIPSGTYSAEIHGRPIIITVKNSSPQENKSENLLLNDPIGKSISIEDTTNSFFSEPLTFCERDLELLRLGIPIGFTNEDLIHALSGLFVNLGDLRSPGETYDFIYRENVEQKSLEETSQVEAPLLNENPGLVEENSNKGDTLKTPTPIKFGPAK